MKIVVIDGQGGKMGCAVIAAVKRKFPGQAIYGIGTNSNRHSGYAEGGSRTMGPPGRILWWWLAGMLTW